MAVDLWAFGCFAFELCAGDSPFGTAKDTHYEVYLRVMGGQYSIPRGWTAECRDLITRMLTEVRAMGSGRPGRGWKRGRENEREREGETERGGETEREREREKEKERERKGEKGRERERERERENNVDKYLTTTRPAPSPPHFLRTSINDSKT